jgi:acetylornithine aminotransferase
LLSALAEQQRKLTGVRPADPERKMSYAEAIKRFGELRGGTLYYPYLGSGIGRGPLVELADGSVKYDMISGIGVHYLGHSHPAMVEAGIDAALRDTVMQGNLEQGIESLRLSETLVGMAGGNGSRISHCFLTTSGAMANENALKLAFQKRSPASRVLAFGGAFAGRTMALSQITDKAAYRAGLPNVLPVDYVSFFDSARPGESIEASLGQLRKHLARFPGQHAAMCFELVQGEGGYYAGSREFFVALMDELKAQGIAIWADEVQTFGRLSRPFAFQHFGLESYVDIVTVGKLTQLCATLFVDDYKPKPGLITQTFTGSTSAIYAAQVILDAMRNGDFFGTDGRIARLSRHFVGRLEAIAGRHPQWLRGPFGVGAMIAFTVFDGGEETTKKLLQALFDAGVIGFIAGAAPARVRFLLPVGNVTDADIDAACDILEKTLGEMAGAQQGG